MGSRATMEIKITKKRLKTGGGSKKGRQSVVHKNKYLRQYSKTEKNKIKAWERHLKAHPNDLKAREDIKKAGKL